MIKAVVFDLDDTLVLERDYLASGYHAIAEKIATDYRINQQCVNLTLHRLYKLSPLRVYQRLARELHTSFTTEYIHELISIYRNHKPQISLPEDSKQVLLSLKRDGYKLGIITDGLMDVQNRKIDILGLRPLFDYIIVTDELGREFWKPHEKPFLLMNSMLGIAYGDTIYVGDNPEKDFVTAKKLGITTVCIQRDGRIHTRSDFSSDYEADYVIRSLDEILALIIAMF